MSEPPMSLAAIEDWRMKSSIGWSDPVSPAFSNAFLSMIFALRPPSWQANLERSLASLQFELELSAKFDTRRDEPFRKATYGLLKCFHVTMQELSKQRRKEIMEEPMKPSEFSIQVEKKGDEEEKPLVMKLKIPKNRAIPGLSIGAKKELECPECKEYRSTCLLRFLWHLMSAHTTTPKGAGIAFRCECGNESQLDEHVRHGKCDLLSFSIIRKSATVRHPAFTWSEDEMLTGGSNAGHQNKTGANRQDKTGLHFLCSCGAKIETEESAHEHMQTSGHRQFTVRIK